MTLVGLYQFGETIENINENTVNEKLLLGMVLCNDATKDRGDPTEIALIDFLEDSEIEEIRNRYERVFEIPFTSESKRMTTVHKFNDDYLTICKGASEIVLALSNYEFTKDGIKELTEKEEKKF